MCLINVLSNFEVHNSADHGQNDYQEYIECGNTLTDAPEV